MNQAASTKPPVAQAFGIDQLRSQREKSGNAYLPFLKVPSMRMGVYALAPGGKIVAKSSIQSIADGCIILENWMPFGGGEGKSWNFHNSATGEWEQVWVTSMGEILRLTGGWKNGAMREEGPTRSATGKPALHRHSFTR